MAEAVAEIYDPVTGRLQVSVTMFGFFCKRTGTGTTVAGGGNTVRSTANVEVAGINLPIIVIRMDGYRVAMSGRFASNETGQRTAQSFATDAPAGTNFIYYIYEWSAALPDTGLFKVKDSAGRVTFSSDYWPLKAVNSLPIYEGCDQAEQFTLNGKILAAGTATMAGHNHLQHGSEYCYRNNSGVIVVGDPEQNNLENCADIRGQATGKLYGGITYGSRVETAEVSWDDVIGSYGDYNNYMAAKNGWSTTGKLLVVDVTGIPIGVTFF